MDDDELDELEEEEYDREAESDDDDLDDEDRVWIAGEEEFGEKKERKKYPAGDAKPDNSKKKAGEVDDSGPKKKGAKGNGLSYEEEEELLEKNISKNQDENTNGDKKKKRGTWTVKDQSDGYWTWTQNKSLKPDGTQKWNNIRVLLHGRFKQEMKSKDNYALLSRRSLI